MSGEQGTGKTLAVFLVGIILTGTIFGAAVATGADRTAFDGKYVSETFEKEGVDAKITAEIRADVAENISAIIDEKPVPQGVTVTLDGETVAEQSITEEFVRTEIDRSIIELFAFLRGDHDDLTIIIDLVPVRESVSDAVIDGIEIDTPTLVGSNSDQLDAEQIAQLRVNESQYQQAQIELSAQEREEIENELEANVQQEIDDENEGFVAAVLSHQTTVLNGITGEITYEEYIEQLASDEQRIKEEIAAAVVDEIPEQELLFGDDEDPESELGPVAAVVQWGATLAWLFPLVSIGLVGLIYGLTRSLDQTAAMTAGALLFAGVSGAVTGLLLRPLILGLVGADEQDAISEGLVAVFDGTLRTIGLQSAVLAAIGVALLVIVLADRRGKLESVRKKLGSR